MLTKVLKITAYTLAAIIGVYLLVMFSFGGYGKKDFRTNLVKGCTDSSLFFAHRGLSRYYPENTRLAMEMAKDAGFKAVEVDIERDKNGNLIVFHDNSCQRLLGFPGDIDTMSAKELSRYPMLFNEVKYDSAVYMMTLKELLTNHHEDLIFYLDMKRSELEVADDLVSLIKSCGAEKECIVANSDITFIF